MPRFVIQVDDKPALARLDALLAAGGNMRPAFDRIASDFRETEQRAFDSQGTAIDHPWLPLSRDYLERRLRRGRGARPLADGALQRSLTVTSAKYSRRRITGNSITLGTGDPIAHLHQRGTKERWVWTRNGKPLKKPRYAGYLPARPVVFVTPDMQGRWRDIIREHLMTAAQHRGLGL